MTGLCLYELFHVNEPEPEPEPEGEVKMWGKGGRY